STAGIAPPAPDAGQARGPGRTEPSRPKPSVTRCRTCSAPADRARDPGAPTKSPAASARAAPVISDSIGITPHLSLPPLRFPAEDVLRDANATSYREGTKGHKDNDDTQDRNTRRMADSTARAARGGEGTHAAQR